MVCSVLNHSADFFRMFRKTGRSVLENIYNYTRCVAIGKKLR